MIDATDKSLKLFVAVILAAFIGSSLYVLRTTPLETYHTICGPTNNLPQRRLSFIQGDSPSNIEKIIQNTSRIRNEDNERNNSGGRPLFAESIATCKYDLYIL